MKLTRANMMSILHPFSPVEPGLTHREPRRRGSRLFTQEGETLAAALLSMDSPTEAEMDYFRRLHGFDTGEGASPQIETLHESARRTIEECCHRAAVAEARIAQLKRRRRPLAWLTRKSRPPH